MFLDVLAPWIIDSWQEALAALSFDIPALRLDLYQRHIAIAATAFILLLLGWHSVSKLPFKARAPLIVLLTLTLLAPSAILTAVHLDEMAKLPQFAGRLRKPANPEPPIQTQRLPEAVALPETVQSALAASSPNPDVLAATSQQPVTVASTEAPRVPSPFPTGTTPETPSPVAAASATIRRVAASLTPNVPGTIKADLMPVFYGTDRLADPGSSPRTYTATHAAHLELGRAYVQVPRRHLRKQGDRPWVAAMSKASSAEIEVISAPGLDLDKQFAIASLKPLSHDDFLEQAVMRLASSHRYKDHALIFIPGFNTSFETALHRAAQLAYDLKFDGAPFVYSWPSDGQTANYKHDKDSVSKASAGFAEFLGIVLAQTGAKSVSVIAHGLGTQLALDTLAAIRTKIPAGVSIGELILTAPDMDATAFKARIASLSGLAGRTTLYVASTDRALNISRRYTGGIPRAGDLLAGGPLVVPGVETVDVSVSGTQVLGLNYPDYVDRPALISDIASRLGHQASGQRAALETIPTPNGPYHRLR